MLYARVVVIFKSAEMSRALKVYPSSPGPPFRPTYTKNNRVLPMPSIYHHVKLQSNIFNRSRVIAWKPIFWGVSVFCPPQLDKST